MACQVLTPFSNCVRMRTPCLVPRPHVRLRMGPADNFLLPVEVFKDKMLTYKVFVFCAYI